MQEAGFKVSLAHCLHNLSVLGIRFGKFYCGLLYILSSRLQLCFNNSQQQTQVEAVLTSRDHQHNLQTFLGAHGHVAPGLGKAPLLPSKSTTGITQVQAGLSHWAHSLQPLSPTLALNKHLNTCLAWLVDMLVSCKFSQEICGRPELDPGVWEQTQIHSFASLEQTKVTASSRA